MKKLFTILFLLPVFARATNYYFSSTGADGDAGTIGAPWQTITKFNSFFASLSPGDSCLFKRGETFYGTMVISRSGTSGSPIIIGAYGTGAKPIITGLATISAWTSLGSGIYESTSAATTLSTLKMVTFQDTMQAMGRWPKIGSNSNGGYLELQSHSGNASITSNAIASALSYVGGEIVQRKYAWLLDRGTITAQTSTVVTYTQLVPDNHPGGFDINDPINDYGFFFQNHSNACTELGEWAFVTATKKIRMYFSGSPSSYTVKVTDLETLVDISSKNYIRFESLQFIGSNSKTFNLITATNIQINNCDIKFSGMEGIYSSSSTSSTVKIYNCTITYTNNNAINGNDAQSWTIQNNTINKTATIRGAGNSCNGQYLAMSHIGGKSLVEYNVIKNTGYAGIHFVGDSVVIKNNFVDSFCLVKNDGGGVYTYGGGAVEYGRSIIGNIILHGIGDRNGVEPEARTYLYGGDVTGIYLDGYSSNLTVTGNTVAWIDYNGLQLGGTRNTSIKNNTVFQALTAQIEYSNANDTIDGLDVKHNIFFAKDPETLIQIISSSVGNSVSGWGTIDSNYYCRPINEPVNIDAPSYIGLNLGGIMQVHFGTDYRMKSLDKWQTVSSQDAHTLKTYATVSDTSDIRFDYNATNAAVDVSLGNFTYNDVAGDSYSYSVNIPAYSSIILLNPVAIDPPPPGGGGIIIRRRVITYK